MNKAKRNLLHLDLYSVKRQHATACYFRRYAQSVYDSCDKSIPALQYSANMDPSEFALVREKMKTLSRTLEKGNALREAKKECKRLFAEYQAALKAYQDASKK